MDIANFIMMILALLAVAYSIISTIAIVLGKKPEGGDEGAWPEEDTDAWQDVDDSIEAYPKASTKKVSLPPPLPQEIEQQEIERIRTLPKAKKALPPHERFTGDKFALKTKYDTYETHTAIDDRSLEIGLRPVGELVSEAVRLAETEGAVFKRKKRVPAKEILQALPSKKALVVSLEVLKEPVSLRSFPLPWNK